jgi:hypothetical protein
MNDELKEFGRKLSGLIEVPYRHFPGRVEENYE